MGSASSRWGAFLHNGGDVTERQGNNQENWKLWDAASGAEWMAGARHDGTGACICEVEDLGHRVLQEGCPLVAHTAGLRALAFLPCGQRRASGDSVGVVVLWEIQTGRAEHRMQASRAPVAEEHHRTVCSVAFSATGARVASGSWDGCIYVWDVATGVLLRTLRADTEPAAIRVQFSPTNPARLASISYLRIKLWDVDSGETESEIHGGTFAACSPDGRIIATTRTSNRVLLVDFETGAVRLVLRGHQGSVVSASFSIDGSKLATGSYDGSCKVWDSSTGALLRTIEIGRSDGTSICESVVWARDWVRDTQGAMAFAMGQNPRLGVGSQVLELEAGVVRMILDRV